MEPRHVLRELLSLMPCNEYCKQLGLGPLKKPPELRRSINMSLYLDSQPLRQERLRPKILKELHWASREDLPQRSREVLCNIRRSLFLRTLNLG